MKGYKKKKTDLWKVRRGLWDLGATFVGRKNMIYFISGKQDVIYEIGFCFALLWGQGKSYIWGLFTLVSVLVSSSLFLFPVKLLLFWCFSVGMQFKVDSKMLQVFLIGKNKIRQLSTCICISACSCTFNVAVSLRLCEKKPASKARLCLKLINQKWGKVCELAQAAPWQSILFSL